MERKKKYRGGLKLLLPILFTLFLSMFSTCYADVSEDYIQYCFDTLSEYSVHESQYIGNLTDRNRGWIKQFADSNSAITEVTNKINTFLQENNISALQDVNCICIANSQNTNACLIRFIFSNVSAPYNVENLDFVEFSPQYPSDHSLFGSKFYPHYMNGTDKIYFVGFYLTGNLHYQFGTGILSDTVIETTGLFFTYNDNNSTLTSTNIACCGLPSVYYQISSSLTSPFIAIDPNGNYQPSTPEPDPEPSGDDGGGGTVTPSGDDGSSSTTPDYTNQLNDINNNISNSTTAITNQISGDTQKITNSIDNLNNTLTDSADMDNTTITSGDILENFSFMSDPYDNFWWNFIDGVELALLGSVRQIPVNWLGYNGVFDLDKLGFNYPTPLKNILTTVSTVCVVWVMLKWWKVIMDKLTSGDIDEVLEIVEEQGRLNITNLF